MCMARRMAAAVSATGGRILGMTMLASNTAAQTHASSRRILSLVPEPYNTLTMESPVESCLDG